jgi:hypothetical protein
VRPASDAQVRKLMKEMSKHGHIGQAAMKADMDRKTARKYVAGDKLPSELATTRDWRTRPDPFEEHWSEIEERLRLTPELEAKTFACSIKAISVRSSDSPRCHRSSGSSWTTTPMPCCVDRSTTSSSATSPGRLRRCGCSPRTGGTLRLAVSQARVASSFGTPARSRSSRPPETSGKSRCGSACRHADMSRPRIPEREKTP